MKTSIDQEILTFPETIDPIKKEISNNTKLIFIDFPELDSKIYSKKTSKLVELYLLEKKTPVVIFGNLKYEPLHCSMLLLYLYRIYKDTSEIPEQKSLDGERSLTALEGDKYQVTGMGKITFDVKNKKMSYPFGKSGDYGKETDKEFNPLIKGKIEEMGWSISDEYFKNNQMKQEDNSKMKTF